MNECAADGRPPLLVWLLRPGDRWEDGGDIDVDG